MPRALLLQAVGLFLRHSFSCAQVPGQEGPLQRAATQKDGASPATEHIDWRRPSFGACLLSLEVGE